MSKHTPGPWIAERWPLGWYVTAPGDFPNTSRRTIAESREAALSALMRHQCEANARLIAAAPEMFSALQRIMEVSCMDEPPYEVIRTIRDNARAAVAKATGANA